MMYTTGKVYDKAELEFGEKNMGKIIVIRKALYGLATSCARFHDHLMDTLCSMDFQPMQFDRGIWICRSEDGESYEYICTHVDDFCIFSKHAQMVMKQIQSVYTVKSIGAPDYYLGNDYKWNAKGQWNIGYKKYIAEAVSCIKQMFRKLLNHNIPM
eukprot:11072917-Ditylum_brightwellii.AAC.1